MQHEIENSTHESCAAKRTKAGPPDVSSSPAHATPCNTIQPVRPTPSRHPAPFQAICFLGNPAFTAARGAQQHPPQMQHYATRFSKIAPLSIARSRPTQNYETNPTRPDASAGQHRQSHLRAIAPQVTPVQRPANRTLGLPHTMASHATRCNIPVQLRPATPSLSNSFVFLAILAPSWRLCVQQHRLKCNTIQQNRAPLDHALPANSKLRNEANSGPVIRREAALP
jgi:hypothetical protein